MRATKQAGTPITRSFPGCSRFSNAARSLRAEFGKDLRGMMPLPGSAPFFEQKALQKKVHKILMADAFKDDENAQVSTLIRTRISNLFAPFQVDYCSVVNLDQVISLLKQVQPHSGLKVIKTWLNGWATSSRMKEDVVLPCLLGCSHGEDSLKHYVMCSHMFAFCNYVFKVDSCPLSRFAIRNPSIQNLYILACVFSAYHAVKGQVRGGKIDVHENAWIRNAWSVFADVLAAEAGGCHIDHVSFSLPKFIVFLTNGGSNAPSPALHDNSSLQATT